MFFATTAGVLPQLGQYAAHRASMYEANRTVDQGVVEFCGLLLLAPIMVSTVRTVVVAHFKHHHDVRQEIANLTMLCWYHTVLYCNHKGTFTT